MEILKYAEIDIIGEIKTKQRPRASIIGGHARIYTPKDTVYYENYIKTVFTNKYNNSNFNNLPLEVHIKCFFKLNQEQMKVQNSEKIPCKTHKDLDNIAKIVLDSLNGIAFYDDKQIVSLRVEKAYTREEEKINVEIMDATDNYSFYSLKHLKDMQKYLSLIDKCKELNSNKMTKTNYDRLNKYEQEIEQLRNKMLDRGNYINDK